MYDLDAIRSRVSLVALAEEAGAEFDNRLSSHCPLPLHAGDRNSLAFSVYDGERRWKCHSSCPADANGGDVIQFYMLWKDVDFKTACAELSEWLSLPTATLSPVSTPFQRPKMPPSESWHLRAEQFIVWAEANLVGDIGLGARNYLEKERGISPETQRAFRLGYNPTNLYDDPVHWGLIGRKIWLPCGIVIPGFFQGKPWYIKVRRPLPGDVLENYIGGWSRCDSLPEIKFGGPRGGRSTLFHLELLDFLPVLVLAEGEFDVMLLWEHCPDFCDAGTLGGAGSKFDVLDLALLTRYLLVLVVHDDDQAGEEGRKYIAKLHLQIGRIIPVSPPAHDLTDFWKSGGNLRGWVAGHVARALEEALQGIQADDSMMEHWKAILQIARRDGTIE